MSEPSFQRLKLAMTTTGVLAWFFKPFILESDASDKGVGVVLVQEGKPIAFMSKELGKKHYVLSIYEN